MTLDESFDAEKRRLDWISEWSLVTTKLREMAEAKCIICFNPVATCKENGSCVPAAGMNEYELTRTSCL